jgi:sterol desaturase/sphingolipid hydroxylase (fatty acid hydroxylase superfamily)
MLQMFIFLFVFQPLIEYTVHRYIHATNKNSDSSLNKIHKRHHNDIHLQRYNNSPFINLLSSVITFPLYFVYCGNYIWCGFFKYQLGHLTLHYYPFLFPQLSQFHAIHHKNPKVNYTLTAMWPDKIFGTYLKN